MTQAEQAQGPIACPRQKQDEGRPSICILNYRDCNNSNSYVSESNGKLDQKQVFVALGPNSSFTGQTVDLGKMSGKIMY